MRSRHPRSPPRRPSCTPDPPAHMHGGTFIATIAAGLGAAFLLGLVAARVGLPPVVGYLVAGILVGPHTPIGFQADAALAAQLAEFGIILLMFGVGLHFSLADLLAVRRLAIPGAVTDITIATTIGSIPESTVARCRIARR